MMGTPLIEPLFMNARKPSNQTKSAPGALGAARGLSRWAQWLLLLGFSTTLGCFSSSKNQQSKDFFTSGSREADQRASQRMAQAEQLAALISA